jgi:hypothetical protein
MPTLHIRSFQPHRPRLRTIAALIALLICTGVGWNYLHQQRVQAYQRQVSVAQTTELARIKQMSAEWASYNVQKIISYPEPLQDLPPGYSGWADLNTIAISKDGLALLPPSATLKPQATGTHSVLVSRLYNLNLYTAFRFKTCADSGLSFTAANTAATGIGAVLQSFDARSTECPSPPGSLW